MKSNLKTANLIKAFIDLGYNVKKIDYPGMYDILYGCISVGFIHVRPSKGYALICTKHYKTDYCFRLTKVEEIYNHFKLTGVQVIYL